MSDNLVTVTHKETGKKFRVSKARASALATGNAREAYQFPSDLQVTVVEDDRTFEASQADAEQYIYGGARAETRGEAQGREQQARKEREHSGVLSGTRAVLESAADTATGGAFGWAMGDVMGPKFREKREELHDTRSTLSAVGAVGGLVVPGMGAISGAGKAGKLARALPAGKAAQHAHKIGGIKGLIAEGVAVGALQSGHDIQYMEGDLGAEEISSVYLHNMAIGGATGGVVGVGGNLIKGFTKGVGRAKKLADDIHASALEGKATAEIAEDLAVMDASQLRHAKLAEQEAIGAKLAQDAEAYASQSAQVDPLLIAEGAGTGAKRVLVRTKNSIRRALDDPKGLAGRPSTITKALREEEKILRKLVSKQDDILAKMQRADVTLYKKLGAKGVVQGAAARKYGSYAGRNVTKPQAAEGIRLSAAEMTGFKKALLNGELKGARVQSMEGIPALLERNLAYQNEAMALMKGTAPRLEAIAVADDALKTVGKAESSMERLAGNAVYGGAYGALASVGVPPIVAAPLASAGGKILGDLVFKRGSKAVAAASLRKDAAIAKLFEVGGKVGRVAPPIATRVLAATTFAPELPQKVKKPKTLGGLYKAREQEILSQVTMGPNGITMRPEARQALADSLRGVRAVSPVLADKMETAKNREVSFLAKKLPKKPDFLQHVAGPYDYVPSKTAMRTFARYVAAISDPNGVIERLADGTLSPEDAEAYREVYPEQYAAIQRSIIEEIAKLRKQLSYPKRLSLSIFSGVAVDPALDPRIFKHLQAQFTNEPGSEGGTQAPTPQPQFGSVKNPEATPGQERAG